MELQVKDPVTGVLLGYTAKPEQWHGTHGFRILREGSAGFMVAHRGGSWRVLDDYHVEPDLLVNIGLALEHYIVEEQGGITDNQPNLNSGMGDDGLVDPNRP